MCNAGLMELRRQWVIRLPSVAACVTSWILTLIVLTPLHAVNAQDVPAPASGWLADGSAADEFGTVGGVLNGSTSFASGRFGQAFSFDGEGEVLLPDDAFNGLASGDVTIVAWLLTSQGGDFTAAEFEDSWMLYFDAVESGVPAPLWDGVWQNRLSSGVPINDGKWHHLASVYGAGTARVYVDGILRNSGSRAMANGAQNRFGAGIFSHYVGLLDEIAIFNVALSADEISAVMDFGLVGAVGGSIGIGYGQAITATIESSSDVLNFEWVAQAGDLTWLSVIGDTFEFDLTAPDDTVIDQRTTSSYQLSEFLLDQTGTYRLRVSSSGGSTGSTTVALSDQPIETLTALEFDSPVSDTISPYGDVDDRPVTLLSEQVITIYADRTAGPGHARVRLLDASRQVVATGSSGTPVEGQDSQIVDFTVPADGDYIVQVYERHNDGDTLSTLR